MTSAAPDSVPGRITYTGPIIISKPSEDRATWYLNFNITKAGNDSSKGDIHYDAEGVQHNLLHDLEGKTFLTAPVDQGRDGNHLATGDDTFKNTYLPLVSCNQALHRGIVDFANSKDKETSREIEGTIIAQLKNPKNPGLKCLVSTGCASASANLTSVEEAESLAGTRTDGPQHGRDLIFTLDDFKYPDINDRAEHHPDMAKSIENLFQNTISGKRLLIREDDPLAFSGNAGIYSIRNPETGSDDWSGYNFYLHDKSRDLIHNRNLNTRQTFGLGWTPHKPSTLYPSQIPPRGKSIDASVETAT